MEIRFLLKRGIYQLKPDIATTLQTIIMQRYRFENTPLHQVRDPISVLKTWPGIVVGVTQRNEQIQVFFDLCPHAHKLLCNVNSIYNEILLKNVSKLSHQQILNEFDETIKGEIINTPWSDNKIYEVIGLSRGLKCHSKMIENPKIRYNEL